MASGPVEYLVIKFAEVVAGEITHVIDFVFVQKDQGGNLRVMELNEMDEEVASVIDFIFVEELSEALENNSAAAIVLIEHTWATRLRDVVVNARGELVADGLIPRDVVELVLDDNDKANV